MSILPKTTTDNLKPIVDLISNNKAFVNPLESSINTLAQSIQTLKTDIIDFSNILSPTYNAGVSTNATAITNSIATLELTLNRFLSHTNNLSGKSLSLGLNGANFATISTIMSTVHEYRNDGSICELIHGAFGAILKAESIINDINNLLGRLANLTNLPGQIVAAVNYLILLLEQQIEDDLNAFASAQIEALQYAASAAINALIGNKCISEVLTRIGSQELKNIVHERINGVFK